MRSSLILCLAILLLVPIGGILAADTLSFAGLEWIPVEDTWLIESDGLVNGAMTSTNTSIYAQLEQQGSILTYSWTIKFGTSTSSTSGPMVGLHLLVTDPLDAARGDSLLVWQDQNRMCLYETFNGTMPASHRYDIVETKASAAEIHSYKAVVNIAAASVDIYRDDVFLYTWHPKNPLPKGNYVSFRTNRTIGTLQSFSYSSK